MAIDKQTRAAHSAELNDALPQPPICASRPNRPFLTSKYALFFTAANTGGWPEASQLRAYPAVLGGCLPM